MCACVGGRNQRSFLVPPPATEQESTEMLQISIEVFLEILGMLSLPLAFQSEHMTESTTLASCSLVCKSWSAPSQQLLFRRVRIDGQWSPPKVLIPAIQMQTRGRLAYFLSTITADTNKSRWLRESVLSIILRPHAFTKSNDILAILIHLPNLRELSIDTIGSAFIFGEAELAQLQNSGPSIRSLHVNTDHPSSRRDSTAWPAVMNLIAAIPTIRMLDVTTNSVQQLPLVTPPLQYKLVSAKIRSKTVTNASQFLASLGDHPLELFWPAESTQLPFAHGGHLRSLSIQGPLQDVHALRLCTRLERFECRTRPTEALIAAIPRTIAALYVQHAVIVPSTPPASDDSIPSSRRAAAAAAASTIARMVYAEETRSVAHLTQQLDTFPNLRVFTWVGVTNPELAALKARCTSLGIEYRPKELDSLSDDEVEFSLRRRLLAI
ncbi:hypothetical protein C8F04DRAFT_1232855 [Mycena alexandri]|uniref:F-box domain-containing protein n=1 Tax=Mycena alexandri TaxID=1745969 RepID=A0AAD6T196_9AGAR|nr:hypothetical protein C8F04DRAFT_1232855 [Mycena alexandri]